MPAMPTNYTRGSRARTAMHDQWRDGASADQPLLHGRVPGMRGGACGAAFFAGAYPRRAASIAAMSILPIVIIASNARLAAARSGSV